LQERVVFPGLVNEQDGPNVLYSGAEAFVFVSCYEGFGLPPAEAMACGTPVIVSNTTSLPEVVQGAGMQVDPENVQAISSAIAEVLTNPSLKECLIRKGQEQVRAYGSTAIAKQTYEFFTNVNQSRVSK